MKVAALITAAGASSRMEKDKALLLLPNSKTLLTSQVENLKKLDLKIYVVVGHNAGTIMNDHRNLDIHWVLNNEWEQGAFSSLRCGLKEIHGSTLLQPVDAFGVSPEIINLIIKEGLKKERNVVPTYKSRGGHPVFLTESFVKEILSLKSAENYRLDVMLKKHSATQRLPVGAKEILNNLNTIQDINLLTSSPVS